MLMRVSFETNAVMGMKAQEAKEPVMKVVDARICWNQASVILETTMTKII
jgi:hypothetical protein